MLLRLNYPERLAHPSKCCAERVLNSMRDLGVRAERRLRIFANQRCRCATRSKRATLDTRRSVSEHRYKDHAGRDGREVRTPLRAQRGMHDLQSMRARIPDTGSRGREEGQSCDAAAHTTMVAAALAAHLPSMRDSSTCHWHVAVLTREITALQNMVAEQTAPRAFFDSSSASAPVREPIDVVEVKALM